MSGPTIADGVAVPAARPWRIVVIAIVGLLVAVAIACTVALIISLGVGQVADRALRNDVELEDVADDLRVAVLEVRHYHRNLVFTGPTRNGLEDFERAYDELLVRIRDLEGITYGSVAAAEPTELLAIAEAYYTEYRPAVELHGVDLAAFDTASDAGLTRLAALDGEAQELDELGEDLASQALTSVESATQTATAILLVVVVTLGLIGVGLAYGAFRVLTDLRTLYAAQKSAADGLAAALSSKNDFIADASHELRTPLTVLRGNAEVALAEGHADRQVLGEIVGKSARMARLVDDLLFLARSDSGTTPLELHLTELEPWLADVAVRAEVLTRQRSATLSLDLGARGVARLDPDRLEQAVMVLVDNAAKYGHPGSTVSLVARTTDGSLVLEVGDDGPGISKEQLPRIFERFYRADRTGERLRGGAGLGLPIARAIVTAHRGDITAASAVGSGTTMTIKLPLAPDGGAT